ncbi:MAG: hypothetical protein KDD62_04425 [Bdellovibrionales bacterium]|nr:hypothetical protein [Bdellovibrionales bacterium]
MSVRRFLVLLLLVLAACNEPIAHNLTENQANTILSGLVKIGIKAEKSRQPDGNWSIAVTKTDVIRAITYMNESRLIRSHRPIPEKESSLVASREDQRFYYERSLSREIEYTLTSIEGVLDARVHLNLPARDPLFGQKVDRADSGSASVLMVVNNKFAFEHSELGKLVAGASGIDPQHISVLVNIEASSTEESPVQPSAPIIDMSSLQNWRIQLVLSLFILGGFGLWLFTRSNRSSINKLNSLKQQIASEVSS